MNGMPNKPANTATTSATSEWSSCALTMAFQLAWNTAPQRTAARMKVLKGFSARNRQDRAFVIIPTTAGALACRGRGRLGIQVRAVPRFAANISLLFAEHPFLDRFEAAAAAGFKAVECQSCYEHAVPAIKERLGRTGLTLALINTRLEDPAVDGFGLAAAAGREAEFQARIDQALDYAGALGVAKIHAMAVD